MSSRTNFSSVRHSDSSAKFRTDFPVNSSAAFFFQIYLRIYSYVSPGFFPASPPERPPVSILQRLCACGKAVKSTGKYQCRQTYPQPLTSEYKHIPENYIRNPEYYSRSCVNVGYSLILSCKCLKNKYKSCYLQYQPGFYQWDK